MSKLALSLAVTFTGIVFVVGSGCYLVVDKSNEGCGGDCTGTTNPSPQASGSGSYTGSPPTGFGTGGTGGRASSPDDPLSTAVPPPSACPSVAVSRFNELMIIDPQVTNDARASNESLYRPWSFRARMEALVPSSADSAGAVAAAWLDQWSSLTSIPVSTDPEAINVSIQPRPAVNQVLLCPWLTQSASGCDSSCANCANRNLELAVSPFRLLAIVNRADAAVTGSASSAAACGAKGGELRFIYGAADPFSSSVLPLTVSFEYTVTLQPGETLRDWAAAWHALGAMTIGSSSFNAKLDTVIAEGLARATLGRVVTNEVAFGSSDGLPWEMRQFEPRLTDAGTIRLVEVAVNGTPRLTLASSADLGQWIDANSASVLGGQNPLPATMLAGSAPIPSVDFAWHTTATDSGAAAAFNQNTCNGCHGGRTDPTDVPFQHVAPPAAMTYYGSGAGAPTAAHLSLFLHNPGHDDELGRREKLLASFLCTSCGASGGAGGAPGRGGAGGAGYATGAGGAAGALGAAGAGGAAGALGAAYGGGPGGAAGMAASGGAGGYVAR